MQFQVLKKCYLLRIYQVLRSFFFKKNCGPIWAGQVSGIFRLFRFRFPTYIFEELPDDFGIISNHTGDQPYFGIWNFWADEVEDLLLGGTFQDRNDPRWKTNYQKFVELDKSGRYSRLSTKKGSRFNRFVIISEALHWTHIERPEKCCKSMSRFYFRLQLVFKPS